MERKIKGWRAAGRARLWEAISYREKKMAEQFRYDLNIRIIVISLCYTDVTKSTMHLPLQQKSWW